MKRFLAGLLAAAMAVSMASVAAMAYTIDYQLVFDGTSPLDSDGDTAEGSFTMNPGDVTGDGVRLGQKIYFPLSVGGQQTPVDPEDDFFDGNYFTFKLVKDDNGKLINSVTATTKKFSSTGTRLPYIVVDLKNSTITDEDKVTFDVYFKAKKDAPDGTSWYKDEIFNARFSLWVENSKEDSGDATVPLGVGTVIKPVSNDNNIVRWGEDYDVASLEYYASDDPDDFYVKLSTKVNNSIYDDFGAPADADLFFRDFSSSDTIDSTSRGVLTLYDPWDEDYDNGSNYQRRVNWRDCHVYRVDSDGYLTDITDDSSVKYVDGDETDAGLPGWQIRTRVLGFYILSDTDLDIYSDNNDIDDDDLGDDDIIIDDDLTPPVNTTPPVPPTGSSDFVALAGILGVASLGAVAVLRKRKTKI